MVALQRAGVVYLYMPICSCMHTTLGQSGIHCMPFWLKGSHKLIFPAHPSLEFCEPLGVGSVGNGKELPTWYDTGKLCDQLSRGHEMPRLKFAG